MLSKETMPAAPDDQIARLAWAIYVAEEGPSEWANPLDLTYGFHFPNAGPQNKDGVLKFIDGDGRTALDNGWLAGYEQVKHFVVPGRSRIYSPTMTILQVGLKYAGAKFGAIWAHNVATELGVTPDTPIGNA